MKTTILQINKNNKINCQQEQNKTRAAPADISPKVAIFDYGAGNLFSLKAALERNGAGNVSIIRDMKSLDNFDGLVLPGVGNFDPAIISVGQDKELLIAAIEGKMPVLGICLGMEMLFNYSQEGTLEGLKIIDGKVLMLDKKKVKVPHMGWNNLQLAKHKRNILDRSGRRSSRTDSENINGGNGSRLLHNIGDNSWVCFVHSYRILPGKAERQIVVANSKYGDNQIPAVIEKGNIFGTQFHPEKSGPIGSQIIRNFLKICSSTIIVAEDK
jgi:imidazole glycerol-phosphate synthase subunit HisH